MNVLRLDFPGARRPGFRLSRFEVYNWGTFHERVWSIEPRSENTLLTGDIGSGKSTLVDALTTLLVAPQKISYNKAAGAETRERTLRSYVAGNYKSERGEAGFSAKPVTLRDRNAYTVILARFYCEDIDRSVTLAQIFWQREAQGQPERLYVIADFALSITEHFASFGSEIRDLRKRLRQAGAELHDSFAAYGAAFRRRLGINDEQAMDLFHQTVSMKSVGNLTDFVREHMLEAFEVEQRIRDLVAHFDDLTRAHAAVLVAKAQIALLGPLVRDCDAHAAVVVEVGALRSSKDALRPWFASLKGDLLRRRLANLAAELERHARSIVALDLQRRDAELKRDELRDAIALSGGNRIETLKRSIAALGTEHDARRRRCDQYDDLARALGLPVASDDERFAANRSALASERAAHEVAQERTQQSLTDASVAARELLNTAAEIEAELESLRGRRSNIPRSMLELRARLCTEIGVDDNVLPFAGELLAVREDARDWEGAAERVLHNFALSLIVPDTFYATVAAWVDRTHLGGRLVYFRVLPARDDARPLDALSLVRKLEIAPNAALYTWLEGELARRFDYVCCDTLDRFRREVRAVTRAGQVKAPGERHEKNDRRHIEDRSQYVLGWTNEAKVAALEKQLADLRVRLAESQRSLRQFEIELKQTQSRLSRIAELAMFVSFRDLDWRPIAIEIDDLERERLELEAGSDILRALERQLAQVEEMSRRIDAELQQRRGDESVAQEKRAQSEAMLAECDVVLEATPDDAKSRHFPELESMRDEALGEHSLTVESSGNRETEFREWLQAKIDAASKRGERLRDAIVRAMQEYRGRNPADAHELDASLEAAPDFRQLLERLSSDDLPRFEARFKELLNENAIREIANFQSQLNRELRTTAERIERINASLHEIEYNKGRYIVLEADNSIDLEIRDFRRDLRACTEGALTGSDEDGYAEAKFLQVRRIIERFRGREGTAELDRRWTHKVTDVRNWQVFSASERWREDDREHEHYTDSGGKSGGQKEKLAYTVLAASLSYQFGLARHAGRSFRFVMIDEAFGRGSDESARYGLELFEKLDLQLLVVTPLQKIRVIEPFVANVALVSSDGRESQLHNLTIEEYRARAALAESAR